MTMPNPITHGGGISEAAARFGGRPEDWLDLSTGINPCPAALPEIDAGPGIGCRTGMWKRQRARRPAAITGPAG